MVGGARNNFSLWCHSSKDEECCSRDRHRSSLLLSSGEARWQEQPAKERLNNDTSERDWCCDIFNWTDSQNLSKDSVGRDQEEDWLARKGRGIK